MVATNSTMLALGSQAPDFSLKNAVDDTIVTLDSNARAKAVVVAFVCNHCPYVIHLRERFAEIGNDALAKGALVYAISSNDVENYPADSPEKMKMEAATAGDRFPYLYDESQEVAKAYQAACTPDFFLFDANRLLVYRGQFDDSRPGNDLAVTGKDLQAALDAVLSGTPLTEDQKPSLGCNVKWKPGNAPDYF
ncbi:MAG: thioredoxin family protein [Opitutae bacterium]|nr:thioredoxin family protein [Opitutae bacterium]